MLLAASLTISRASYKLQNSREHEQVSLRLQKASLHFTGAGGVRIQSALEAELEATLADRFTLQVSINLQQPKLNL